VLLFSIGKDRLFFRLSAGQRTRAGVVACDDRAGVVLAYVLGEDAYLAGLPAGFSQFLHPLPGHLVHHSPGAVVLVRIIHAVAVVDL
jgi:hypothetical protein